MIELVSSDPRVQVGYGTYASGTPLISAHHPNNRIIIGKFCSLGHEITIFAGGNHPMNFVTTHPLKLYLGIDKFPDWTVDCGKDSSEATRIGNDVWVGHGSTILSGADVGDGAIIGACSVVRGIVPPYAIVVGNPAHVIRYRFDQETIAKLLTLKWWDWSEDKIKAHAQEIASPEVSQFLATHA